MKEIRRALPLAAATAVVAAALAADRPAAGQTDRAAVQSTVLISRTPAGGIPNGPSR